MEDNTTALTISSSTHSLVRTPRGNILICDNNEVLLHNNITGAIISVPKHLVEEIFGYSDLETNKSSSPPIETGKKETVSSDQIINNVPLKKTNYLWSRNAILRLIHLYADNEEKFHSSTIKNEQVYKLIAAELQKEGFNLSAVQCRDKFKYLKLKYMKVIDSRKTTGTAKIGFDYFEEMDALFGKKPNACPVALASSCKGFCDDDVLPTENALEEQNVITSTCKQKKHKGKRKEDVDVEERRHQENLERQDRALDYFSRYLSLLENNQQQQHDKQS